MAVESVVVLGFRNWGGARMGLTLPLSSSPLPFPSFSPFSPLPFLLFPSFPSLPLRSRPL